MRESAPDESNRPSHRTRFFPIALLLIFLFGVGIYALRYELRSAALLIQFLSPQASGLLVRLEQHQLDEQDVVIPSAQAPCAAGCISRAGLLIRGAWFWFLAFIIWELTSPAS
jgi:hypothetical protein